MSIVDDERDEQRSAQHHHLDGDDRPTHTDTTNDPLDDLQGECGGCGRWTAATLPRGVCLWRGGYWHPDCRAADKAQRAA